MGKSSGSSSKEELPLELTELCNEVDRRLRVLGGGRLSGTSVARAPCVQRDRAGRGRARPLYTWRARHRSAGLKQPSFCRVRGLTVYHTARPGKDGLDRLPHPPERT